ncbi:hypothetical protein AJ88_37440 [Mesorhizobium amorphae CCBAU 01583]|nr:hypothetical protein AJ88_37440 [Mesorhizobium amorphae CCBAU 01583]
MRSKEWSSLRAWGISSRRRGMARPCGGSTKLAVILHRMWADATEFRFGKAPAALRREPRQIKGTRNTNKAFARKRDA